MMLRLRASYRAVGHLLVLVLLLSLAMACSSASSHQSPEGFWEAFRIEADEVEYYATIGEMGRSADAVAIGKLVGFDKERTVQGDAPEDVITYVVASFEVSQVVAGKLSDAVIPLEFLVTHGSANVDLESALPEGDLVVFLREKRGSGEGGLYRAVNSLGLWTSSSRAPVDTPLAPESPADSIFADEVRSLDSLTEFASYVGQEIAAD